ncbi:MAG: 3'(2'),5'-bisphosphate nucleotidase CysQ [Chitinophagaceae bacterium]
MDNFQEILSSIDVDALCNIAIASGNTIMAIYNDATQEFDISFKDDLSPLTKADKQSHKIIKDTLYKLYPDIPLLSEEGADIDYEERKGWTMYWCVDPLDGTKEFIKKNGEFTVNISLVIENHPWLGIIYIPAKQVLYYANQLIGAWKKELNDIPVQIFAQKNEDFNWTAIGSRTHSSSEENLILSQYPIKDKIFIGSSIKFCYIAEGMAQIYCRTGPTMEWDTAAGQAIVECAGGVVRQLDGTDFVYNKESLVNPGFVCLQQNI